ncbi:hypothetical protein M406DRAFT_348801 [Cryphonectria parasitica EP155]|uniref:Oxidoreductase acuF-like C2H2 type zinc-finger domain-containing protein n=1 Tax=Cryphonectria parasitica (strain ATCC 38755 / EP155) TaxID=660469 RepID=A0A9P4YAT4_CRYP1|nr:uncharacterized protein M406DRAFT_348801 [Cryphonectria parasitica EP155]KAF3769615.1 hypothetical protein M406DRAFT_348801 [Cryphonectria parasitica EP155]
MTSKDNTVSNSGVLAALGARATGLFLKVKKALNNEVDEAWPVSLFLAESERFELWAANLGLFVPGHGSLDYRVREAERLAQTLQRLLGELIDSLDEVMQMLPGAVQEQTPVDEQRAVSRSNPGGAEHEDEDEDVESDIDLLLDGIRDPINRLFKISTQIRNPSTRLGSLRAAKFQQVDEETGVDLLQTIEKNDRDYIRSMFLQYQKFRAFQEHDPSPPENSTEDNDDAVWEPIRTVLSHQRSATESFLIDRITQANVKRRQQFAYWSKHRDNLHKYTNAFLSKEASETEPSPVELHRHSDAPAPIPLIPANSVTTATTLNIAQLEVIDNRSTWTVSEYAPSIGQPARDTVDFPPPPKLPQKTRSNEPFECPFCFTFCPREFLADKAWKAHLIHDLRPYMCTYEDCRNPTQLYDRRQDWIQHENSAHRRIFVELDAYKHHLRSDHAESYGSDESSASRVLQASESIRDTVDRPCPICMITLGTARAMQDHIVLHLERFACFSLPHSATGDNESDFNAESNRANGVVEGTSQDAGFSQHSVDADTEDLKETDPRDPDMETALPGMELTERAIETFDESANEKTRTTNMVLEHLETHDSHTSHGDVENMHLQAWDRDKLNDMEEMASIYSDQCRWDEAEKLQEHVIESRKSTLGADHLATSPVRNDTLIYM